jgi:hypothetical protein
LSDQKPEKTEKTEKTEKPEKTRVTNRRAMNLLKNIKFFPLLISFALGIFIVYILKPTAIVIIKYPNPENVGKLIYKDRNGTCFVYETKEVDCNTNEERIRAFPLV